MRPKLLVFDLDGTLLASDKCLTDSNRRALYDMVEHGARIGLASGRMVSSIMPYARALDVDMSLLTLNGAAVYESKDDTETPLYEALLPLCYVAPLITHCRDNGLALNFYYHNELYAVRDVNTAPWIDLYFAQTRTPCRYVDTLEPFTGNRPSKMLVVAAAEELDKQEKYFRELWNDDIYIVRTWDYYLEFLHRDANKGKALAALAHHLGIALEDVAVFGDEMNDIPMLEIAGTGIAMGNAPQKVKAAASRVSPWSNDEDGVAREWERLKGS